MDGDMELSLDGSQSFAVLFFLDRIDQVPSFQEALL